jgi:TolB-like protein/Flp pilus assembly protein TadD
MSTAHPVSSPEQLSPERIGLVRQHLKEVLGSRSFAACKRAQGFLQLIVEHSLEGQFDCLSERMIGAEMFGRPIGYDTGSDSVVRVKATEVRKKLAQYYLERQTKPAIRIELASGSYVPRFHFETLEETPPPKTEVLRLISATQPTTADLATAEAPPEAKVSREDRVPEGKLRRSPRLMIAVVLGIAFLAVIGYTVSRNWHSDANAQPEIRSIAILPLENLSGDPSQEYFADGMTEALINDLGQASTQPVISLTSAMSYKGTKKKLPEIASELAVDGVVEGTVQREGNQVRISAQLIDAKTDRPIWAHTYVRDLTSVLELQGEVAQAIADEVSVNEKPQQAQGLAHLRPVNAEAEDLYLQGMRRLNADDLKGSTDFFLRAIAADPNSAPAHAALADCYGWIGESGWLAYSEAFSKQRSEAARAIELDDSLPEGHAELANAAMNLSWDWATAANEFRRARQLNPSSASIHERYAVYLARTGELPEAVEEVKRGIVLDPVSHRSYRNAGFIYYFSRQYDQALSLLVKAQALNINPPDFSFLLGDIYAERGMFEDSIAEFMKSGNGPHALGHLGNAYARAGKARAALKTISQLQDHVQKDGVGRYEIALVYAGLNKKNEAFLWLENAYKAHDEGLTNLKIDPCLDPLRSDPRFEDLVRRVGLSQ